MNVYVKNYQPLEICLHFWEKYFKIFVYIGKNQKRVSDSDKNIMGYGDVFQ